MDMLGRAGTVRGHGWHGGCQGEHGMGMVSKQGCWSKHGKDRESAGVLWVSSWSKLGHQTVLQIVDFELI